MRLRVWNVEHRALRLENVCLLFFFLPLIKEIDNKNVLREVCDNV